MAKLPRPKRPLPPYEPREVTTIEPGSSWWRVYAAGGEFPSAWNQLRNFGPLSAARFDHQLPPPHVDEARAVCYLADLPHACFAECFQDGRTIDRSRKSPWLVQFTASESIRCLNLSGAWPTRVGASQAISSGRRDTARLWSQAIYEDYSDVQGLLYASSMFGGGVCLALYEKGRVLLPANPHFNRPLVDPGLDSVLREIAGLIGYVIV